MSSPILSIAILGLKNASGWRQGLRLRAQQLLDEHPQVESLKIDLLHLPHSPRGHIYKVLISAAGYTLNFCLKHEGEKVHQTLDTSLQDLRKKLRQNSNDYPQAA